MQITYPDKRFVYPEYMKSSYNLLIRKQTNQFCKWTKGRLILIPKQDCLLRVIKEDPGISQHNTQNTQGTIKDDFSYQKPGLPQQTQTLNITQMLELSDNDFKVLIVKMLQ